MGHVVMEPKKKSQRSRRFRAFLQKHSDDVLIFTGASLLVYATAMINLVAMVYLAGAILIIFGVLIGMGGRK